jgi:hypothetical protein
MVTEQRQTALMDGTYTGVCLRRHRIRACRTSWTSNLVRVTPVTEDEITELLTDGFAGVDVVVASESNGAPEAAWGDRFFYYAPDGPPADPRRFPFATIVTQDYEGFDTASDLGRDGVFRLNLWVSRETFQSLFGPPSAIDPAAHDYTALDRVIPHPVYAAQSWVSVLNPGPASTDRVRELLAEAHARAVHRHERRGDR